MLSSIVGLEMCISDSICCFFFFCFKQKTAYEMLRSLVGSEMCIRDRVAAVALRVDVDVPTQTHPGMATTHGGKAGIDLADAGLSAVGGGHARVGLGGHVHVDPQGHGRH